LPPTPAVARAAIGDGGEPRARLARPPALAPLPERRPQGLTRTVLGRRHVPGHPGQRGDHRGTLDPPDGVEAGGEIVHRGPSVEGSGSGGAELFAPALFLLDVLVVGELLEIGLVGDPPYLEDDSRTHRCPTCPLGGLVLRSEERRVG